VGLVNVINVIVMHKRGLCRCGMSVRPSIRLSVRPSRSCVLSKRINISSKFLLPLYSHTILVFLYQTLWQYSDMDPLTGASNAGRVGKNRGSQRIAVFIACCERPSAKHTAATNRGKLMTLVTAW